MLKEAGKEIIFIKEVRALALQKKVLGRE